MSRILIFTAVVLMILAALSQTAALLVAALLLILAVLISLLWHRRAVRALRWSRTMQPRAFLNDQVSVAVHLHNRGLLPLPWLRVRDSVPVEVGPAPFNHALTLMPRERREFRYTLQANRRGLYRIGPMTLHTGDVLGLGDVPHLQGNAQTLTVYPKIVPLPQLGLPSRSPLGSLRETQPIYEDPSRVRGKRDYTSGDSLRRVDWKTSAATGRLQVRQFEPSIALEAIILLDLNRDDYDRMTWADDTELAIVVAGSLGNWIMTNKESVGLATNGLDPGITNGDALAAGPPHLHPFQPVPPRKGRGHFMTVLDVLARVKVTEKDAANASFVELVQRERVKLAWGSTLVLITGKMTDDLFEEVFHAQRSGLNAALLLCGRYVTGLRQVRQRAAYFGITTHHVLPRHDFNVIFD